MSKAHVETDAIRAARAEATVVAGTNAHGEPAEKLELIDPNGNLVFARLGTQLKPGWRYATDKDRAEKAIECERQADAERKRNPSKK